MIELEANNKQLIRDLIRDVWVEGHLDALKQYWTDDCVNHAAPEAGRRGLPASGPTMRDSRPSSPPLSGPKIEILQQIAEGDRVVTQIVMRAGHTGEFMGMPRTGRKVSLATIRIDRIQGGRIADTGRSAELAGCPANPPCMNASRPERVDWRSQGRHGPITPGLLDPAQEEDRAVRASRIRKRKGWSARKTATAAGA